MARIKKIDTRFGYVRENQKQVEQQPYHPVTGVCRVPLTNYLEVLFPETHDWICNQRMQEVPGFEDSRLQPDFRSESLKLIIEVDGLPHYRNPTKLRSDLSKKERYEGAGYRVVRIPYFIQLTKDAVRKLFGDMAANVEDELFDPTLFSLSSKAQNSPAFLCPLGIRRMAMEFLKFPEQYQLNLAALKAEDNDELTGVDYLEMEMERLVSQKNENI